MAIPEVLTYLIEEVNNSLDMVGGDGDFVELGNIALLESSSGTSGEGLGSNVILTLVNINEETSLKNSPHYISRGDTLIKRNPTLYLNIYVLFSCAADRYDTALSNISQVISFFQQKHVFTAENAAVEKFPSDHVEKLTMDIHSLEFEQMNHLWGVLGGKYYPSVLYRVRLLPVQDQTGKEGPAIKEFNTEENAN